MSEPFIGEIRMFGGNFAPRSWALCDGQLLAISQNDALFSLLGTIYGGDGRTTFGLPDLRGRIAMHAGSGPGLTTRRLGEKGGAEQAHLTSANVASHSHTATLHAESKAGVSGNPTNNMLARAGATSMYTGADPTENKIMSGQSVLIGANASSGQGVPIRNPLQCVNYIIALFGIYPSRQ